MKPTSPHVQAHNLLQGFPFPSDHFDVVYHSQVLEHFPKEKAPAFMAECYRVLRPGGVLRVVVPDLENIAKEYLRHLAACVEDPNAVNSANYDWIMLELYDQTVRNYSGGEMAKFLSQPGLLNEDYAFTRSGRVARNIVERARQQQAPVHAPSRKRRSLAGRMIRKTRRNWQGSEKKPRARRPSWTASGSAARSTCGCTTGFLCQGYCRVQAFKVSGWSALTRVPYLPGQTMNWM